MANSDWPELTVTLGMTLSSGALKPPTIVASLSQMREHGLDPWSFRRPEHLVRGMPGDGQAQPYPFTRGDRSRHGPSMSRRPEDKLTCIEHRVVQVWVITLLEHIQLGVGDLAVGAVGAHPTRRLRVRTTVPEPDALVSSACSSGSASYSAWARVTTTAG